MAWRVLVLAALMVVCAAYFEAVPEKINFTEDLGLSFAITTRVLEGTLPLLGPPSHTGGRHLGPIYYWYLAIAHLLGGNAYGMVLVSTALLLGGVGLCAWLASSFFTGKKRVWAALWVFGCACSFGYTDIVRTPWHAHFLLLSGALFLWSWIHSLRVGPRSLLWLLVGSTVLLQTHYSSAPLLGVFWLVVVLRWVERGEIPRDAWAWCAWRSIAPVICFALLWAPAIFFEIRYGGNFAALLDGTGNATEGRAGVRAAFRTMFSFLETFLPTLSWRGTIVVSWVVPAAVAMFSLVRWRNCERREVWLLGASTGAAIIFYLFVISELKAPLFYYFVFALLAPVLTVVGVGGVAALELRNNTRGALSVVVTLGIMIFSVSSVYSWGRNIVRFSGTPHFPFHTLLHGEEVGALIRESGDQNYSVLTPSASSVMRVPFLVFSGGSMIDQANYWVTLREFHHEEHPPIPLNVPPKESIFVVACPRIYSRDIRRLEARELLGFSWDSVDLTSRCSTCENCLVRRYQK